MIIFAMPNLLLIPCPPSTNLFRMKTWYLQPSMALVLTISCFVLLSRRNLLSLTLQSCVPGFFPLTLLNLAPLIPLRSLLSIIKAKFLPVVTIAPTLAEIFPETVAPTVGAPTVVVHLRLRLPFLRNRCPCPL
ncbi:hypothetical protein RchiOBHm_Chr1g0379881 [Rosa chinensis]|uniref:Uncharacterized protein n=1 Tax=Rosa chinensis TaxID=74649 RepID=A0A2P6SNS9_ROSCH|nr:hypothetical protein RchiOBHm_Chr1g0379881 [Rosa chinensis]